MSKFLQRLKKAELEVQTKVGNTNRIAFLEHFFKTQDQTIIDKFFGS